MRNKTKKPFMRFHGLTAISIKNEKYRFKSTPQNAVTLIASLCHSIKSIGSNLHTNINQKPHLHKYKCLVYGHIQSESVFVIYNL